MTARTPTSPAQPVSTRRAHDAPFGAAAPWMTLLGKSETGGRDSTPQVEGQLPSQLRGSLYRNGPGRFESGGVRIRHLLDGDGLIQRLSFSESGVRYQNAFVRTQKLVDEEASGRRGRATWTTRKSEHFFQNLGGGVTHSQAGVTVYPVHGKWIARDEIGPSYEIDPDTLATVGTLDAGRGARGVGIKAHSKLDPEDDTWIVSGTRFGPRMDVHVELYAPDLRLARRFSFRSPRQVYTHDFFASRRFLIFVLHPCEFTPWPFLAGFRSFTDSLRWRGDQGNLVAVVPRDGGEPRFFEAPGALMWHALNAFEEGERIVADFVGYDEPDHFIGPDALFANLMQGRMGRAQCPGTVRRYRIDLAQGTLAEEIVHAGNHEFPMLDGRAAMARHRVGYFACGGFGAFNSGLTRIDYGSGATDTFDFGPLTQVGEPVFAPRPGGALDEGWLIAQCLDGSRQRSFFALFDAQTLGKGPIAKLWLDHPVPISFHGAWTD